MKKYRMMKEANAGNFEFRKTNSESTEKKDVEMETSKERDVFPDLLSFATNFYQ